MPRFIVPSLKNKSQASCRFKQVGFRQPTFLKDFFIYFYLCKVPYSCKNCTFLNSSQFRYTLSSIPFVFFLSRLLISCVSVYLRNWKQAESEAVFLHLPGYYEHLVLGRGVTSSMGVLVSSVNTEGCQGWVMDRDAYMTAYLCVSEWMASVFSMLSIHFCFFKDSLGIF